jgi:hypothetical protein
MNVKTGHACAGLTPLKRLNSVLKVQIVEIILFLCLYIFLMIVKCGYVDDVDLLMKNCIP